MVFIPEEQHDSRQARNALGFGHLRGHSGDLCPEGGCRAQSRVEWREDKGGLGWFSPGKGRWELNTCCKPLLCYLNFPECETMFQKHLPGGPRTKGNHADRLMEHRLPACVGFRTGNILEIASQPGARHFVLGYDRRCPSGTKAILPDDQPTLSES